MDILKLGYVALLWYFVYLLVRPPKPGSPQASTPPRLPGGNAEAPPTSSTESVVARLEILDGLKNAGKITDAEYQAHEGESSIRCEAGWSSPNRGKPLGWSRVNNVKYRQHFGRRVRPGSFRPHPSSQSFDSYLSQSLCRSNRHHYGPCISGGSDRTLGNFGNPRSLGGVVPHVVLDPIPVPE